MPENEAVPVAMSAAPADAPGGNAPRMPAAREFVIELACRSASATLLAIFAYGAIRQWLAAPARITLVLLVVTACVTVGLSLFSKVPARRDWTPTAFLLSVGGTYYFLAVQLAPGVHLMPEWAGATLQVLGLVWQLFAKASLRRAFGILPANRGVVSSGAYRFMRHPMYVGYFLADIGFLLVNFDVRNVIVYGAQFALQAGRIWREERLLSDDEQYRAYRQQVRYRILPGLF